MKIKNVKDEEEIMLTYPPDPLHANIIGPGNDCVDLMESIWPEQMKHFFQNHSLHRSGDAVRGKFSGKNIKFILKEKHLQELSQVLPVEAESFLNYLRSVRELHKECILSSISRMQKRPFLTLKFTFGT